METAGSMTRRATSTRSDEDFPDPGSPPSRRLCSKSSTASSTAAGAPFSSTPSGTGSQAEMGRASGAAGSGGPEKGSPKTSWSRARPASIGFGTTRTKRARKCAAR